MKKTFLAMLFAGGTMSLFAQTTQTTQGSTTTQSTNSTMNNQNSNWNNTMTNGNMSSTSNNNANWGVGNSTSWSPETNPNWGWNSYGIWNGSRTNAAAGVGVNAGMNNGMNSNTYNNGMYNNGTYNNSTTGTTPYNNSTNSAMNGNMSLMNNSNGTNGSMNNSMNSSYGVNASGNMNTTGSYSAYGTPIAGLPANVQMRYNQDFPTSMYNNMSWSQYGDWFNSYYKSNGRLTQYFYDQRGNGYSLALPVLQSYVPEDIVQKALDKYGSNLYSISMVKTPAGSNAYQVSLLHGGQVMMDRLDDNGASVTNSWRTEDMNNGSMNATQSNAAMGNKSNWNNQQQ